MPPRSRSAALIFALVTLLGSSASARGVEAPAPISPDDLSTRLKFVQAGLDEGQFNARAWWYSWMGAYTVLAVGQLVPAIALRNSTSDSDRELRVNLYIGAATAAASLLATAVPPLSAMYAGDKCRGLSSDDPLKQVRSAEALLVDAADGEVFGRSWIAHVITVAMGLVSGLVLWLGYGYLADGAVALVSNIAVGELQIWTQPMRAADDAALYHRTFRSLGDPGKSDAPSLHVSAFGPGLAFSVTF